MHSFLNLVKLRDYLLINIVQIPEGSVAGPNDLQECLYTSSFMQLSIKQQCSVQYREDTPLLVNQTS